MKTVFGVFIIIIFSFSGFAQCELDHLIGKSTIRYSYCSDDSNNYVYPQHIVATYPEKWEPGEDIMIIDKNGRKLFLANDEGNYFMGIADHLLFVDNGTSNIRAMDVFNLFNGNQIKHFEYLGAVRIIGEFVHFEYPIGDSTDSFVKPECPPELKEFEKFGLIGYIEQRKYNIRTNQIIRTGIIKCRYFE